jgi:hypothetical protein
MNSKLPTPSVFERGKVKERKHRDNSHEETTKFFNWFDFGRSEAEPHKAGSRRSVRKPVVDKEREDGSGKGFSTHVLG